MARKRITEMRKEEIGRLLGMGMSVRNISQILKCSRKTVRKIRDGDKTSFEICGEYREGVWAEGVYWEGVLAEYRKGHPLKYIWEEGFSEKSTYISFWRYFYKRFPLERKASVTHREFTPGQRCEVDWCGFKVEWIDIKTGEVHDASIFIGALGFSQYIFAKATHDEKNPNFLESHARMYEHFGGVPCVTVPDCLKQGVTRCHLYDPDINPSYTDLAKLYKTAIVPARPGHPKDKAIVEVSVGLVKRYFRWIYRGHTFTSLEEINRAVCEVIEKINKKPHTRFKRSRYEMWFEVERAKLKPLPLEPYEYFEWREAKVHPDCHVSVDSDFYSVPHIHRGKTVKVRTGRKHVEIYLDMERIALHPKSFSKQGRYITRVEHLPPNSRAYLEATPQNILSQAKFINRDLHDLIDEIFKEDTLGNLRRALGLVRSAREQMKASGYETAQGFISRACETMKKYKKIRVPYFKELLKGLTKESYRCENREIKRGPNNTMLRHNKTSLELIKGGK